MLPVKVPIHEKEEALNQTVPIDRIFRIVRAADCKRAAPDRVRGGVLPVESDERASTRGKEPRALRWCCDPRVILAPWDEVLRKFRGRSQMRTPSGRDPPSKSSAQS